MSLLTSSLQAFDDVQKQRMCVGLVLRKELRLTSKI